jgi:hypothetical protein
MTAPSPRGKGSEPAGPGLHQVRPGLVTTGTGLNPRASRPGGPVRQRVTAASQPATSSSAVPAPRTCTRRYDAPAIISRPESPETASRPANLVTLLLPTTEPGGHSLAGRAAGLL